MTIFITGSFKVDLSLLGIKFSDQNTYFEKDLIKQQSFPFKIPNERSFIPFFEFISSHNSTGSNTYIKGKLFRNDSFYEAELLVLNISTKISAMIYYSPDKLTIFNQPLNSLQWPQIEIGTNIYQYAKETILKDYPETLINFTKISDPERYKDYNFGNEAYKGFTNNIFEGNFLEAIFTIDLGSGFFLTFTRMNEMRPFVYKKEILKFIFAQIGYSVVGDVINDPSIAKALQYHDNSIFFTRNDFSKKENLALVLNESNVSGYPGTVTYNKYLLSVTIHEFGFYKIAVSIEGAIQSQLLGEACVIEVYYNGVLLKKTFDYDEDFSREFNLELNIPIENEALDLEIFVVTTAATFPTIEGEVEINGTLAPLYEDEIGLKDLMPDMTVGEYVTAFKETFALTSIFNHTTKEVKFDFFDSSVDQTEVIDLSNYKTKDPPRKLNKSTGYKIEFADGEIININKKGEFVNAQVGFSNKSISIEPLPVVEIEAVNEIQHQDGNSLFFFESNPDAAPLVIDGNIEYTRLGFIHRFLRNWLYQNLNYEEYNVKVNLPLFLSSQINAESKLWYYNNFFLIHSLNRTNINPLFEKMEMRLFKLKNIPKFNFEVIEGDDGNEDTEVTAVINPLTDTEIIISPVTGVLFIFSAQESTGNIDSYLWEIIQAPAGSDCFIISPGDVLTSLSGTYNLNNIGTYILQLTVSNSTYSSSATINITVTD